MYRLILKNGSKLALKVQSRRHAIPRQAGFGKVFILLVPLTAVGGAISYANRDKDFRKTFESNIPGSKTLLALEEKFSENIVKQLESVTTSVPNLFGNSENDKPSKSEVTSLPVKTQTKLDDNKSPVKSVSRSTTVSKTEPVEILPADIVGLEKEIEVAASLAVQEYNMAISVLNSYNDCVKKIVEKSVEDIDPTTWTTLKNKTSARDTLIGNAEKLAVEAIKKMEKCELALSEIGNVKNNERIMEVRKKIKTLSDHINDVKNEVYKSKDISKSSEKYWKKVEESRNYFVDQIESIFPGINLAEKKFKVSEEDIDLFILHAYSHVLAYQKELKRLQIEGENRLKRAIEAHRGDDQSFAVNALVEFKLEKEKQRLAIENQNKILQIRVDSEKQLRKQLKHQAEAHVDHLNDAISVKEAELKRNYQRELEEKLAAEKASYKLQLAEMLGKLLGIDAALKASAESERSTHQAQALWSACQALWATVRTGEPGVHWRNKLRPLKSEISAVTKVSECDELVSVVLGSLPKTAETRGVFPEDALRERFINVEKVARRVALVPKEGASLPIYILSYLQSLFILRPDEPVSKKEMENELSDFSKMDTYDILNKARYFVDGGNLMQALKYMNLLQGAPRKVASDWLKETRLLLETQQAANTLMAHAAASGVLYL
ncbi:MICOS complex subunit Mic60 [Eupeodes corollae]|uniref:MICOS complex subunit Mic60 n=1 Tax=Eupeodes corollae TaxID=290404 RepID=UPI002493BEFA|nr:MICOS complex subunit Mic60 [Eupeodes corollae]